LTQFGPNALPEPPQVPRWQQWLEQFESPLIYILLFALIVDLTLWLWQGAERCRVESISIGLILLLNAGLAVYQEGEAEQSLARLKALARG
jgi:Ca2+-transporting ATPase